MCNHERKQKYGKTKSGEQRYKCLDCDKTYTESTATLAGMRIGTDKAAQIVHCMMEGVGVRGTARLAGVCKDTVLDTLLLVGQRCKAFCEGEIVDVPVQDVQCDELWSFIGMKERTRKLHSQPASDYGDSYCFVGLERSHKLALAWHVGHRTTVQGQAFLAKLRRACKYGQFQISTDAWQPYKHMIPNMFPRADFGMVIKVFGPEYDGHRYSPGKIVEMKLKPVNGNPDLDRMNTSHVERHNLTMRMSLKRFTRLTNCYSRKVANHEAALALYFAHYNFCQRHSTIKTAPAVAAGIANRPMSVADLIDRTADYNPPERQGDWQAFLDTLPDGE